MFIYRPTRKKPNALSLTSEHKQDIEQMMARGYTIYNMAKVINRSESLVRKYITDSLVMKAESAAEGER